MAAGWSGGGNRLSMGRLSQQRAALGAIPRIIRVCAMCTNWRRFFAAPGMFISAGTHVQLLLVSSGAAGSDCTTTFVCHCCSGNKAVIPSYGSRYTIPAREFKTAVLRCASVLSGPVAPHAEPLVQSNGAELLSRYALGSGTQGKAQSPGACRPAVRQRLIASIAPSFGPQRYPPDSTAIARPIQYRARR